MRTLTFLMATLSLCPLEAQLIDATKAPNPASEGIAKSLEQQIGAGRGDVMTPDSSTYIITRDPFRAIRRGRQLFQRKFVRRDGSGAYLRDGVGDIVKDAGVGAGSTDSCAACHGRPRGSAGFGGSVATRPDSRDAPHLFGLGLKEMLADEITSDLRTIRDRAIASAKASGAPVAMRLDSKTIHYGQITARPDGSVDTSRVEGVDSDLRVRPFFAHGGTTSIREFVIGAMNAEMGFQCTDKELWDAAAGKGSMITPAGMRLDGAIDRIESPPEQDYGAADKARNEIATALVDYLEFYLLNYFKPGTYEQNEQTASGRRVFERIGCTSCHIPDLRIEKDRRVADVETVHDPARGVYNKLFATATPLFREVQDAPGLPSQKLPKLEPFVVRNIFADFKRHDLGPNFHERNYDLSTTTLMLTAPLWGVGSTAPYGHDGRSINLNEVILRHGGEAQGSRDAYEALDHFQRDDLLAFLNSLVLFPPDDTASNLDPGDPTTAGYPQARHGAIKLTVLFNDPKDIE